MEEEWRVIENTNGVYYVSSIGRVKSVDFIDHRDVGYDRHITGRILKISTNIRDGYCYVFIRKNKERKTFKIHRLVAFAFIPQVDGKHYVNHKNGIKADNRVENLEWCTSSENALHRYRVLHKINLPKGCLNLKVSKGVAQYAMNGEKIAEYISIRDASRKTGIDRRSISRSSLIKHKQAGGYIWSRL